MDRICFVKKRSVYPEHLELDSLVKTRLTATLKAPINSWCYNGGLAETRTSASKIATVFSSESKEEVRSQPEVPLLSAASLEQESCEGEFATSAICRSGSSNSSVLRTEGHLFIHQRIRYLVQAFTERAQRIRRRLEQPPTPSTVSSEPGDSNDTRTPPPFHRTHLFRRESRESSVCRTFWTRVKENLSCGPVIDPESHWYVVWLFMVTLCFVYNCWVIPLRSTFPYQTPENANMWFALDYSADFIYLVDVALVKPRISHLEDGFWVTKPSTTRRNYFRTIQFKMDVFSLLPLDILYLKFGTEKLMFRLPRMLKVQTFWECYNRLDSMMPSAYVVRMARTLTYMLYLIHLNACAYYAFSAWQGLGANGWVFSGKGSPYIRCFYFATKTATSIGKNPKPETEQESLFMTCSWLMGVFVFAILIGQMRDIVVTATHSQTEYRKLVDETLEYMRRLNLPKELQERIKLWFTFTWEQQHTLDEHGIIDTLPHKMKTDIAINVHIQTLSKVQLFHDCDEALLRELVLKLKPIIFLPNDYICHKGEVGKEMYIVKTGLVEVMGGEGNTEVLATLTEGSVFGEISLLALSGGNRRTADVRSKGFSNLFILSKSDLNESIVHYPEAQEILKKKARYLMKQNAARERKSNTDAEIIIGNPESTPETPRLVHTVMQVVPPNSGTARLLKYGSRKSSRISQGGNKKKENTPEWINTAIAIVNRESPKKKPEPGVNNIPENSNGNQQHEYSEEMCSTGGSQQHVSYVNPQPIHNSEIHQFGSNIKGQKLFCHSLERQIKNNSFVQNNKIGPSQYCNEFQSVCINEWGSSCGSNVGVLCNNEYEMMDKNETKIEIKNESFALCNNVHYTAQESSESGVNNDDNTFQCLVTVHRSMSQ